MSSSSKHAHQISKVATIMNATQQVKEKRGARAHAHEARAERMREKFHADAEKNVNENDFKPQNALGIASFNFGVPSLRKRFTVGQAVPLRS